MESLTYGQLPEKADIIAAIDDSHYEMQLVGEDKEAVTDAVNQGIDAHLEAVMFDQFDAGHRLGIKVEAESMPTLLRRLCETEQGENLASCIMDTLGFEWI